MPNLHSPDGRAAPWPDLWQRRPLLVLLAHDVCERCDQVAEALAASHELLEDEDAQAIVVSRRPRAHEGVLPLHDPEEKLRGALHTHEGSLLAVDRFFEVRHVRDAHAGTPEEAIRAALDWIDLSLLECPECGAPTW